MTTTALHLGDVADGPVTLRVGGSEPVTFEVLNGVADVPATHVSAVLATFDGSSVVEHTEPLEPAP